MSVSKVSMAPDGPEFSEVVQGYWRMEDWQRTDQESLTFLKQHLELGVTTVDHAHVYGNQISCEELFGRAIALEPAIREQIEIVSKCGIELCADDLVRVNHYNSSPQSIVNSVETSLKRLGTDRLDVLLIHRPDWLMNVDEVARVFESLLNDGKVLHFGVSNFTPSQFSLLQSRLSAPLVTNQVEINPINFNVIDDGTLDQLQQYGIRPMAWSCLAGGRLFSPSTEAELRLHTTLTTLMEELGAQSIEQVVYAWVRKLPSAPIPLIGSGTMSRIRAVTDSMSLELEPEQWYRVWEASMGHSVP